MGLQIAQPADVDVLLPQQRLALFITDGAAASSTTTSSSSSSGGSGADAGGGGSQVAAAALGQADCLRVAERFVRANWAPPVRFVRKEAPGIVQAKQRGMRQRGWRTVSIPAAVLLPVAAQGREADLEALLAQVLSGLQQQ